MKLKKLCSFDENTLKMAKKQAIKKTVHENTISYTEKDNDKTLALVFSAMLTLAYFAYSFLSKGFYQHDELGHFITMKSFWNDPNSILTNWSKPGFKLLYAIPSLFGMRFVYFTNALVCGLTAYFTYDVLKKYDSKYALLSIFLLGLTPIWFQLSFRSYSEFTTALMLVLALRSHQREKFIYAALFVSYASFIRQEILLVNGLYFLYLVFNKQFLPALLSGTFAIVINIWGYFLTGNFLFLYDFVFGYASKIGGTYLEPHGLSRIPEMTGVLYGAIVPILFVVYLGSSILLKKHLNYFIFIPLLGIYTYFAIGDATWLEKGIPINTRQLTILVPFLTILAILGIERFQLLTADKKKLMLVFIIPYIILVGLYMTYNHNWVYLDETDNYTPLLFSILTALVLFIPLKINTKIIVFVFMAVLSLAFSFKKFEPTEEDKLMKRIAEYYMRVSKSTDGAFKASDPVYASHIMFKFYQNKGFHEFGNIDEETIKSIPKGSVVFWDSHYSYRPKEEGKKVAESYFLDRSHEYRFINTFTSKDNRVKVSVFIKYNESDTLFENAILLSKDKKYQASIPLLEKALAANPNNASAYYYLGLAYQNLNDANKALQNYSTCLQINPNSQDALFNRGALYSNYGKYNEALTDMNNYVKLNTQNANAYFYLGNIYFGLANFDQAIVYYQAVLRFNNSSPETHYNLGMAYINKKDKTNACNSFNEAKKLGHKQADEAIKKYCQ